MPSTSEITVPQLQRLVGLPDAPAIIDVRTPEDFQTDPRLLPAADRCRAEDVPAWAHHYAGRPVVVVCQRGLKLSQGAVAWLRHEGIEAEALEGGFEAWRDAQGPLVNADRLPPRGDGGRTLWVTRARPKVDRVVCPWLIRRFVDPRAVFLYVPPGEVLGVAERFDAVPFDVDGVFWSHRGEACTFDTMLSELGLATPALQRLAIIIRGADTARLDLAPQAAGFLAACLGLSRMFRDDLQQLEASMTLCDAFYRWCRDAAEETHNWPNVTRAA